MPEKTTYSLLEIAQHLQKAISDRFVSAYWIRAEMNKLNHYVHSGHCFPELLEKQQGKVVAQMRSTLWRDDYSRINRQFIEATGQPLNDGVKIMMLARVSYDPIYGLSLRIMDIDPTYTLGDLEREKRETIFRLQKEGIFSSNKALPFPILPQRIAIISVESSKGLADFMEILLHNPWGYRYYCTLFPSHLQGDKAVETITRQLASIREAQDRFDMVAIIRGGGDDIGLSCFNHYKLARAVAMFPLPVLSGIGHATNETVTEMVTHHNAITPTKLAEFLIQAFHNLAVPLAEAEKLISEYSTTLIRDEHRQLHLLSTSLSDMAKTLLKQGRQDMSIVHVRIKRESEHIIKHQRVLVNQLINNLKVYAPLSLKEEKQQILRWQLQVADQSDRLIKTQHDRLLNLQHLVGSLHPDNVLKRGYSITSFQGRAITGADQLTPGDSLHTRLYAGSIHSIVQHTQNDTSDES